MSKRVNNKKGNRASARVPNKYVPCKVRGGFHGTGQDLENYIKSMIGSGHRFHSAMKARKAQKAERKRLEAKYAQYR